METLHIAGRRYSDPDIISLARESGELIDPRFAIISRVRLLLERLGKFEGVPTDPLERLKIIASLNGINVQPMDMDQRRNYRRDAAVFRANSRWVVLFNPNRPRSRTVFTVAHEIVHTLFPNSIGGARFRSITSPDSRESNELERLCDLGAAELAMPMGDFRLWANGAYSLTKVESLAAHFGTSFEATAFRLATAHPRLAVAGLLRYRLTLAEQRKAQVRPMQSILFPGQDAEQLEVPEKRYRRQSLHLSALCDGTYFIPWNKSFDASSVVYQAASAGGVCTAVEQLPSLNEKYGRIEVTLCPYQSDDSDVGWGDVLFFWEELP